MTCFGPLRKWYVVIQTAQEVNGKTWRQKKPKGCLQHPSPNHRFLVAVQTGFWGMIEKASKLGGDAGVCFLSIGGPTKRVADSLGENVCSKARFRHG